MQELQHMLMYALIYRIVISFYEAICLSGSGRYPLAGGFTVGKWFMGIKVVSFQEISALPDNCVQLFGPRNLGVFNAILRSMIKNFSMSLMFPACLTIFFFDNGRAIYDIVSNAVVVEARPIRHEIR